MNELYNKSTIVEIDGTKVGIIGYVTKDTVTISSPGPNVTFLDEIERSVLHLISESAPISTSDSFVFEFG